MKNSNSNPSLPRGCPIHPPQRMGGASMIPALGSFSASEVYPPRRASLRFQSFRAQFSDQTENGVSSLATRFSLQCFQKFLKTRKLHDQSRLRRSPLPRQRGTDTSAVSLAWAVRKALGFFSGADRGTWPARCSRAGGCPPWRSRGLRRGSRVPPRRCRVF